MCGRYTLATPLDELVEVFDVGHVAFDSWQPRFNVAPTQTLPVVIRGPDGLRRLGPMRWGLVPFWAKDPSIGNRMINARSETVAKKPAFREAFRRRRCVVPMDGFYEWRARAVEGSKKPLKVPFWIHRPDRRPFGVAGLWERWRGGRKGDADADGAKDVGDADAPLVTFTILTTAASPWMTPLHDRMPAILTDAEATAAWLDPEADAGRLADILKPAPGAFLEAWEVSRAVNRPAVDEADCVAAVGDGERFPTEPGADEPA
ncbi:MAG: SOS response-associated peptidase [Gemmatimonadetes bacterium]|nr:SOS response-associated peptidase [Gemmatimonadota bacterium]MBT8404764.1 SOS response-associated peptidase [Gemmatimonadota bacterium]NNK63253.1 SOS response-associated peptidase [Gemmatimonadota bacterium]